VLSTMAGAMLIARAMPDQDQAAKAIGAALESAFEAPASSGEIDLIAAFGCDDLQRG
jgi:hypothetical protein